jgi:hypothetical protein
MAANIRPGRIQAGIRNKQIVDEKQGNKKGQVSHIAPLQPSAFARFPAWRIKQELVV